MQKVKLQTFCNIGLGMLISNVAHCVKSDITYKVHDITILPFTLSLYVSFHTSTLMCHLKPK